MDVLPKEVQDVAVLRRLIFASVHLPVGTPNYWSVIAQFAEPCQGLTSSTVRVAVENLHFLNEKAFATDKQLAEELRALSTAAANPLGVVLVPSQRVCKICDGMLIIRGDRPSHVTIYTETQGTVVGTHFHKFCQNYRKGCSFNQYYGYCSKGDQSATYYDSNWAKMSISFPAVKLLLKWEC